MKSLVTEKAMPKLKPKKEKKWKKVEANVSHWEVIDDDDVEVPRDVDVSSKFGETDDLFSTSDETARTGGEFLSEAEVNTMLSAGLRMIPQGFDYLKKVIEDLYRRLEAVDELRAKCKELETGKKEVEAKLAEALARIKLNKTLELKTLSAVSCRAEEAEKRVAALEAKAEKTYEQLNGALVFLKEEQAKSAVLMEAKEELLKENARLTQELGQALCKTGEKMIEAKPKEKLLDDVITNILSRLPVKTLLRFRCVSKGLCALLDSPDFIKQHLNHSLKTKTSHSLILRDSYLYSVGLYSLDRTLELDHPLKSYNIGTEILGSVDGLLCLYNSEEDIVLWNLATRKYQKLPITEIEFPGPPDTFQCCQFIVYGFGYDAVSDDYKLLRLVQFYGQDFDSFDSEAKVYSLRSNSWQRIQDFPYYLRYKRSYGELACGALHWVVSRTYESDTANLVGAFDLATNEYRLVAQPDIPNKGFHMNVGKFEGSLCLTCNYINDHVDIWVMKNYGVKESWSKIFSVSQPKVIPSFDFVIPLAYSRRGDEILLVQDNKKLIWYNLKKRKASSTGLRGCPDFFDSEICVESLVPLSGKAEDYAKKQEGQGGKKKQNKSGKKSDGFLSKGFKLVLYARPQE